MSVIHPQKPRPQLRSINFLADAAKARPKVIENPAVLPPFGTMLPVRTQGVIFTLRNNSTRG